MIGCGTEIVYIGQAGDLLERPIDSLGRYYHRVPDVSLPWSLALASCPHEEMRERESAAIRTYAPRFNTSIPTVVGSYGRMPEIEAIAPVFQDQADTGGAFDEDHLLRQIARARESTHPAWRQGNQRKKTGKREPKPELAPLEPSVQLAGAKLREAWERYGVPSSGPFLYPVNLCDNGTVVTRDGEYLGNWGLDQYDAVSFTPDGENKPVFEAPLVGLLCMSIRDWHEERTGERL